MNAYNLPKYTYPRRTPSGKTEMMQYSNETQQILYEAEQLGITWSSIPDVDLVRLTYKDHTECIRRGPSTNHVPGPAICSNKAITRAVLQDANLPVAKGFTILNTDTDAYIQEVFDALQKPLVAKPSNGTHGNGVKLNITNFEELRDWARHILQPSTKDFGPDSTAVVVEEMGKGEEYRIIVTRDRVLAVMNRQPASVVGDGMKTIQQLIDEKNTDPMRNISELLYPHIKPDEDMMRILQKMRYTLETIPKKDEKVVLREVSNIMAGGDAFDVTDDIHPSVADIAVKIALAIPGMTLLGVDFMTTDIHADQASTPHMIVEVNSAPEFDMHDIPMNGQKRDVAKTMLLMMFPELKK
jgi:cyanophycin synthetase